MSRKNDDVWGALPLSDKSNRANDQLELGNTRYIREMKYQKSNDIHPTSTLDETLHTLSIETKTLVVPGTPQLVYIKGLDQAHQAIAIALEAIIGEDEDWHSENGVVNEWRDPQNQLRREQRKALALYLNPNSQETQ